MQPRAVTTRGREQLVARRVVHDRGHENAVVLAGDGHGVVRDAVEVVHGAIERIDVPASAGRALAATGALLRDDRVIWIRVAKDLDHGRLRGPIGVEDHVGAGGLGREPGAASSPSGLQRRAGRARRLDRDANALRRVVGYRSLIAS